MHIYTESIMHADAHRIMYYHNIAKTCIVLTSYKAFIA